jgi:hypothetical protein
MLLWRRERAYGEPEPIREFKYLDERTLRGNDEGSYNVLAAISQLRWVRQLCPFMPHEYAILSTPPDQAWVVVEAMIRLSPRAYRAFFSGYQRPNRYWDAPDSRRYWRPRFEIDRWDASDAEGLRRRDEGARAIKDWDGPRWAPSGAGYYVEDPPGRWGVARSSSKTVTHHVGHASEGLEAWPQRDRRSRTAPV